MARSLAESLKVAKQRQNLILSQRVHTYLAAHPEGLAFSEPTAEEIKRLLMKKPRDRRGSFSPSASGYCARRQVFGFLGTDGIRPFTTDQHNLFSDGTWRHLRWQAMGLDDGWFTGVEVSAKYCGMFLGSMDGDNTNEGWLFELKGTSTSEKKLRGEVLPFLEALDAGADPAEVTPETPEQVYALKHWRQVQRYFAQTGDRYEMAVLMMEPKTTQSYVEMDLRPTKVGQAQARQEMHQLEQAVVDRRLPAPLKECMSTRAGATKKACPYGKVCLERLDWDEATPSKPQRIARPKRRRRK